MKVPGGLCFCAKQQDPTAPSSLPHNLPPAQPAHHVCPIGVQRPATHAPPNHTNQYPPDRCSLVVAWLCGNTVPAQLHRNAPIYCRHRSLANGLKPSRTDGSNRGGIVLTALKDPNAARKPHCSHMTNSHKPAP